MSDNLLLDAALDYAALGIFVFPLHNTDATGACSCGRADCHSAGKHPRTGHGHLDATTDPQQIRRWWAMWPDANIAIATGPSGLIVVDVDEREGRRGTDVWRVLVEKLGPEIEDTAIVATPSGGFHVYFRAGGREIPSRNNAFGPGIDVKAQGGYVVAPPSIIAGRRYEHREKKRHG